MAGKSRRKGADAERALVNYLRSQGLDAHRVIRTATSRDPDPGDVHMRSASGLTVWQVKAGEVAKGASETLLGRWWAATNDQARVAGADACVLLTQRRGSGVARIQEWQAVVCLTDIAWLHDAGVDTTGLPKVPVRLPLGSLVGRVTR